MGTVRVSGKALIVEDGRLLCIHKHDADGDYYILPGGGQEHGEQLDVAIRRECMEEMGVTVEVHALLGVRDYIGANHQYAWLDGTAHNLDLMFRCTLVPGARPAIGVHPDVDQIGVAWLPIAELATYAIFPQALAAWLPDALTRDGATYLGDVN